MMRFRIATLGCKVNQHESDVLAAGLSAHGWQAAEGDESADVCVVNTCTVTQRASMQSRQLIRQLQRAHPGAVMIVTGCYAQIAPEDIEAIEGVHAVVGQHRKMDLPGSIVEAVEKDALASFTAPPDPNTPAVAFSPAMPAAPGKRTRPFLKVQDGCNSFCTYCIVPYARGRSRSMPPEQVLQQLDRLGRMGYREVVLTGIHLGAYGLDLHPATHLLALMEAIERRRPVDRVRLSSIEPNELTEAIIDLTAGSDLFCDHFHLPLQSGDDAILERMHRPYDSHLFRRKVETVKERLPHAAIGVDVLVGFPGETERASNATAHLIDALPVSYLHVFPFSPRPGTPAGDDPNQLETGLIKSRTAEIRAIGAEKKTTFMRGAIGRLEQTLVENRRDASTGLLKGLTSNYLTVLLDDDDRWMNTIVPVRIEAVHDAGRLSGKIDLPD